MATTAACQQVFDAILLGLDPVNHTILINDVDADTVLAVWLLQYGTRWRRSEAREQVRPLVASVAARDAHGPAYPVPAGELCAHFQAQIMQPSRVLAGTSPTPQQLQAALDQCLALLEAWWQAGLHPDPAVKRRLDIPPLTIRGSYALVAAGQVAPTDQGLLTWALYEAGHDRLVLWSRLPSGRFRYGLAKRSDLVSGFPLPPLYDALNQAESQTRGMALRTGQTWGGGSTVGGSPRDGSILEPESVIRIIDHLLASVASQSAAS